MKRSGRAGYAIVRVLWRGVRLLGVLTLAALLWMAAGAPIGIDRWLDVTEPPLRASAIVVLGGGTAGDNLPLAQGWDRIATAAKLFSDGFAPTVVFSGGGTARVSESEVYANAAAWLGVPRAAMLVEAKAQSTAGHGHALLGLVLPDGTVIGPDTPLLVVTSTFHSRRALLAFSRARFTRVRVVSRYTTDPSVRATNAASHGAPPPTGSPVTLTNTIHKYKPSGKRYDDVLFRLAYRMFDLFMGLREVGAIVLS